MKKLISFMHISLDGFVAGPNGEMDWINFDQELFDHVGERISKTDAAMYGRRTYQLMESYWPAAADKPDATKHDLEHSKWYNQSHKIVLSQSMKDISLPNTTIIRDNLSENITVIKQNANTEILLFGSPSTTHSLIRENLIDGYWLFVNPIILGKGISLFTDIKNPINLNLLGTRQFNCGVTELNYSVRY